MAKHTQTIRRRITDELFWVCLAILLIWHLKGSYDQRNLT